MERQEGTKFQDIRNDHLNRYYLAAEIIQRLKLEKVTDIASGVGYGSKILSTVCKKVVSIERDKASFDKGIKYYNSKNINFVNCDVFDYEYEKTDMIVCFEFLEHTKYHNKLFKIFKKISKRLIISTPNENIRPYLMEPVNPFHIRHWKPDELKIKLEECGFELKKWFCQKMGKPEIYNGYSGKFMIAYCERLDNL